MSLVFAGICSHAPGILARAELADTAARDSLYAHFDELRSAMESAAPDVLVVIAAEHFANFFMNNMPPFALGMADTYEGPIEDEAWLRLRRRHVPGDTAISRRMLLSLMQDIDLTYCEEWKIDHGIAVPLHFLTPRYDLKVVPININCQGPPLAPLSRVWAFGEALRIACDEQPERVALIGTGGISHWPATPDSGRINEQWDRKFLDRWARCDRAALLSYTDEEVYRDAGQGGFEIRTLIAVAAAAAGQGNILCYLPIPIFAVGCTAATMSIGSNHASSRG